MSYNRPMILSSKFFSRNRHDLIARVPGIIVLTAYESLQQSNDASHRFEQEANFWYLTGISEPGWKLIIDGTRGKSWLVRPNQEAIHIVFDGSFSSDEAKRVSGVDDVISIDEAAVVLSDLSKKHSLVYSVGDDPHSKYYDFILNPASKKLWKLLERTFKDVRDCRRDLARLRAIKQPEEIYAIKRAIKLTIEGFDLVKKRLPDFSHEYQVEAEFTYHFRRNGSRGHAYEPIVASGGNACTLHYDTNNEALRKNSLLLLDIGAVVGGYPADITRTYAYGTVSARAAQVHASVRRAHNEIIALLAPGLSVAVYQERVDAIMKRELIELHLMKSLEDTESYRRYFPHAISHGLGVDVHDSLGAPAEFLSGMILTVEPGIYIPEEGIGVRLEDDILITDSGHQNLSKALSLDM